MLAPPSHLLLAALALAPDTGRAAPGDSARVETPRIVRRFEELLVRAPVHDVRSSESVHLLSPRLLRALPADALTDAIALKAGVVAQGEALHVRGGRAGEMSLVLEGIHLNEPLRDRPPELPLLAVRSAELVSGGFDAEYGGALAGVLVVHTVDPGERWSGEALWRTDGRRDTRYDRVGTRLGGPLGILGLGAVATAEVTLDDTDLPALRSQGRRRVMGGSFGWRASDRMLAHLKLAPVSGRRGFALQLLAGRRLDEPYDPMWSLDGWTTPCDGPDCIRGPRFSPTPKPGYERYRAADHAVMTDERHLAAVLAFTVPRANDRMSATLGFHGWVAVHDPRLGNPPRTIRLAVGASW
jgi:outer membrane receptor protein involved in Fe transport